jgi:hypothetical protein
MNAWRSLMNKYEFLTISKLVGILVILSVFLKIVSRKELLSRMKTDLWYPLAGLLMVSIISTFYSDYPLECINDLRQMITVFLFLALTLFFIREKEIKKVIPIILIASTSFSAFIAVAGKILNIGDLFISMDSDAITGRAIGTANDPNFFAAMILVSLPLIAHFFSRSHSTRNRMLFAVLFIHNCYAVILTYSRGVTLALCFTVILILFENFKRIKLKYLGFLIVAIGIMAALLFPKCLK